MRAATFALLAALAVACGGSDAEPTDTATAADTATPADTAEATEDVASADTAAAADTTAATDTAATDTAPADTTPVDPNDPCHYAFSDQVSYLTHLAIGSLGTASSTGPPDDHCCYDFDNDGAEDNRLGEILALVQALPQVDADLNELIAANVVNGAVTLLLELVGLDLTSAFSEVTLNAFYGADTDDDHGNNTAGQGTFTVNASSFEPGTATPAVSFPGASVVNGNLYAGPSVFHLAVPLGGGLAIEADIRDARLEGTVAPGPDGGVRLDGPTPDGIGGTRGARLGGLIHEDELYGALNTFTEAMCGCLTLPVGQPLLSKVAGSWRCASPIGTGACDTTVATESACATLGSICSVALLLITPDIASSGAGPADAFSVGVWVKGTGARVVGVEPAVCAP